jgi:hypothetical protein
MRQMPITPPPHQTSLSFFQGSRASLFNHTKRPWYCLSTALVGQYESHKAQSKGCINGHLDRTDPI